MSTLLVNGVQTQVIEVDVVSSDEKWNSYLLSDGTVLRQKTIITKVFQIINVKDIYGNPCYITYNQQVFDVSASNIETMHEQKTSKE